EKVDGPRIAAQILKTLRFSHKERLVQAIVAKAPTLARKIVASLFNFDDISELTPQGIQTLIKEVDHSDLVLSFKLTSNTTQKVILENMSERKRNMLQSDFESLPPVKKAEVEDAQKRILTKLDELRTAGAIRTQGKNEVWV
ncbi:MAG: FliG C-terminal domain-containing protein, partial [bacterium]|nr:FliG C-terminal domain-containing protein [bacterium]